jgi:hypothetical protein
MTTFRLLTLLAIISLDLAAQGQQPADGAAWLQFIGIELRALRSELLEQQIMAEKDRLAALDRDLAALRREQSRNKTEEALVKQHIADLERQAEGSDAGAQSPTELQAVKDEFKAAATARISTAHAELTTEESQIQERLRATKARLQTILERLNRLNPKSP